MWLAVATVVVWGPVLGSQSPIEESPDPQTVVIDGGVVDDGDGVVDDDDLVTAARERLDQGAATEAVGLLLGQVRRGELLAADRIRASAVFSRAADVLCAAGEVKGAAVAADAAAAIDDSVTVRAAMAVHLARYAETLLQHDPAAARGLAERALAFDADNDVAKRVAAQATGMDSWEVGHLTLGAGLALGIVSATAFVAGLDVERQARGATHRRDEIDVLLLRRGIAAGVAWPAAVGAVITSGVGLALIMAHDPGPEGTLPSPFPTLPLTAVVEAP